MSLYEQLRGIPVPTGAQVISETGDVSMLVQVTYSVQDHARLAKRSMSKTIALSQFRDALPISTPLLDSAFTAQLFSPSRSFKAVWRTVGEKRIVEVWKGIRLIVSADVTELHGDLYAEEYLSSFSWAPSEHAIAYTAEGNAPKSQNGTTDYFERFRFNPDFGEGLTGRRRPTTFILSWKDIPQRSTSAFRLTELKPKPGSFIVHGEPVRFGQVVFSPVRDDILYATGYEFTIDGRMLGPRGCFNRPTGIWQLRLADSPTSNWIDANEEPVPPKSTKTVEMFGNKLTPPHLSCRSSRIVSLGEKKHRLIFFASKSGGAHVSSSSLEAFDLETLEGGSTTWDASMAKAPEQICLVDVVNEPKPNEFPGLYPDYNLPYTSILRPSSSTSTYVAFASHWGSKFVPLLVRVSGSQSLVLKIPDGSDSMYSWDVLSTDGKNKVVCSRSSPSVPPEIVVGTLDVADDSGKVSVQWEVVDRPETSEEVESALKTIQTSIVQVPSSMPTETIVIRNKSAEADGAIPPCITLPHGGPHATITTAFSPMNTSLVLEGYTMNIPNYPGSPGYGQAFIDALLGRCGELDLDTVMDSVTFMNAQGWAKEGPGNHFIFGGSHGGFLGAHMLGSHPNVFSGAVLRNPVISCGDISSTDIPDWYFSEFGYHYPLASSAQAGSDESTPNEDSSAVPPTVVPETYAALTKASPLRNLENIRAPVLLLLGANDRRVANTHGIGLYHALKGRGRPVELLIFEGEGHGLDGVEVGKATFEVTKEWFGRARK